MIAAEILYETFKGHWREKNKEKYKIKQIFYYFHFRVA